MKQNYIINVIDKYFTINIYNLNYFHRFSMFFSKYVIYLNHLTLFYIIFLLK